MKTRSFSFKVLISLLTVLMVFPPPSFARYPAKPSWFNAFSTDQEIQLGKENAEQVAKEMPLVTDPQVNAYIQKIGANLAAHAPGPKYPYSFHVVNSGEINAFALPGGPVFVNLGLIQAAQNESQLAGVMGHEISHIVMRHSTNQATKQQGIAAIAGLLGGGSSQGLSGQLKQMGISFLAGSVLMKYSRDAEKQADLVGVGIAYDSGYDPEGAVQFFKILEEKTQGQGGPGLAFFSDHPIPVDREQYVAKEVSGFDPKPYVSESADFKAMKARIAKMHAYTAQEIQSGKWKSEQPSGNGSAAGAAAGAAAGTAAVIDQPKSQDWMPSGSYKTFEHQAFTVDYPGNWQFEGSATTGVQSYPASGKKGDSLAYAMIINGAQTNGASLADATSQLAQGIVQSNQGMSQLGDAQDFKLNGRAARSTVLLGPSPILDSNKEPLKERDWLVTVDRGDGTLIYLIFVAPDRDFKTIQPEFTKMLKSLKVK